jgi:IS30 family transposase
MKLSQDKRNKIKELYEEKMPLRDIAKKLKISYSTAHYHAKESNKKKRISKAIESFRKKTLEERKKIYKSRRNYMKEYQRRRYKTDKKFREVIKKKSKDYKKKHSIKLKGGSK